MAVQIVATTEKILNPESQTKMLNISWDKYYELGERLAKQILMAGWEFDQIICIARGGMFLGDMFSRIFNKPLGVIFAKSYTDREQSELSISSSIAMLGDIIGKRVLLVDDLVDSGVTLINVKRKIEESGPGCEVKSAVLWNKSCSKYKPDFYVDDVEENIWIVQPFEKYDDVNPEDL